MLDLLNLPGVEPVDLRSTHSGIVIIAQVTDTNHPTCPTCGKTLYRHGHRSIEFADTPQQMQPVRLVIDRPRYRCDVCRKTLTPELPFLDEKRRATRRLIEAIRGRCLGTTFHALAEQTGLAVNTIKNIALDLIAELEQTVRYETPVIMGIDELNLAGGFRCIITNLATNSVFGMLEERTKAHMEPFFRDLVDREKVEWVCTDMRRPFKKSFGPYLPNARLVIDKFHLVRMASDALDEERKMHQAALSRNDRVYVKKSIRWLTLKRPASLSPAERAALDVVRETTPLLIESYDFKESFYRIYDEPDKQAAMQAFYAWENSLPEGRLDKFHKLAKTVHNHFEDIFAYWDAPHRITNGYTEGLNGLVKVANRMGRGYSYEIIRAKTLYAKHARKVGSGVLPTGTSSTHASTTNALTQVEYGPHIPTLIEMSETGELD
jgi:transposase